MGAKKWEQYLWEELHIIPVGDFNKGRIRLLDIFAQDGRSYQLRNIIGAGDDKPFRRRALTRIGSMLTLGDNEVEDWPEQSDELSDQLVAIEKDEDDIAVETFSTGFDGPDRAFVVGADSKFLASAFGFVEGNFGKSATLEIQIRSPVYARVEEDALVEFIDGASWKPDLRKIAKVKRKGVSLWRTDEKLELWIVTELKLGTINYTSRKGFEVGANVRIPGAADLATLVPVAGGGDASSSVVRSRQVEASASKEDSLYGFKAVRVTFDEQGNYVSRRGDMGKLTPHVTRADEESDLDPDADPEYHMSTFFLGAGSIDEDLSGHFECVELVLDDITEEDISP